MKQLDASKVYAYIEKACFSDRSSVACLGISVETLCRVFHVRRRKMERALSDLQSQRRIERPMLGVVRVAPSRYDAQANERAIGPNARLRSRYS